MKDQTIINTEQNQSTEKKPIIDLLALWEEVEEMIQEKRALEGEKS